MASPTLKGYAIDSNPHKFFINVLPNALIKNPEFLEQNRDQVLSLGLLPEQIVFELTEVEALFKTKELARLIQQLREWGFGLAIDDFCGSVSLDHYVMEFRPDIVKLDQRLVQGCSRHTLKQILIKSLMNSAREMEIRILAEGLEDNEDIAFCRNLGIDYGQGFGLGTPETTLQQTSVDFSSFALSPAYSPT